MNKQKIAQRFAQANSTYKQNAIVQTQSAEHLVNMFRYYCELPQLNQVLEIGCGAGTLTDFFSQHYQVNQWYLNDLYVPNQIQFSYLENKDWLIGDIESVNLPQNLDAVISSSALQWIDDLSQLFLRIEHALIEKGYFCFSSFSSQNLSEIKQLTQQGLTYFDLKEIVYLLEKQGFEVLYQHEEILKIYFDHPKQILLHLKQTGVTATNNSFIWTRKKLEQFYGNYSYFQNESGQYSLTYHPIYLIARKKS